MTPSTGETQTLPSPIWPVRAASTIASATRPASPSSTSTSMRTLGTNSTVFGTTVDLGVAALAAEAAGLGHRDARDAERLERLADVVELERLDDGGDEPHSGLPKSRSVTGGGGGALAGSWPTNAGAGPEDCSIGGPVVGAWPPVLVVASTKSG